MRQLCMSVLTGACVLSGLGNATAHGQTAPPCTTCAGDLNGDGLIGLEDLFNILTWYGAECPVDSNTSAEPSHTIYISEIHYNPATEQGSDSDFEFVELHNTATNTANVWGWNVAGAVTMELPQGAQILPGGFLVLARNADSLCVLVPQESPCYQWDAGQSLNNTGETVELYRGDGSLSDEVPYEDNDGWIGAPDGGGPSLEWMDVGLDNDDPASWGASFTLGGTPGQANSMWGLGDPE